MRLWKVKSKGRLERIIVVFVGMAVVAAGIPIVAYFIMKGGIDSVKQILVFTSIIWVPLVLVILKRILSAKIPKELSFDSDLKLCSIRYSRKSSVECEYDNLAFSVSGNKSNYCVLTLYQTYIGTRGQTVFNEITKIVGLKWTMSWKMSTVFDIVDQLSNNGIEETYSRRKGMPLWELLFAR